MATSRAALLACLLSVFAAASLAGDLPAGSQNPGSGAPASTVEEIVQRAGQALADYADKMSLVVGKEQYAQYLGDPSFDRAYKRMLVSEFALVRTKDDWAAFRDVIEVDGKRVSGHSGNRLQMLFLDGPQDAISQARRISDESARQNLGAIMRNFNVPTMALYFLQPENAPRFTFSKIGEDRIDDTAVWKIRYEERQKPAIFRTSSGKDMPVSGTFWIEAVRGTVLKTHMEISVETAMGGQSNVRRVWSTASVTVTYHRSQALGVPVPAEMRETYETPTVNRFTGNEEMSTINSLVTYSDFKRVQK